MTKVAVILESDGHGVKDSVHAALTLAAAFGSVIALTTSSAETVLDACARYGAARIITVTGPGDLSLRPICAPPRSRNASRPKTVRM